MLRRKLKIMKKLFICLFLMITTCCFSQDVHVNGYITGNGTYVQPHYRTAPDNTQYNNYSTVGNVNPYTGKAGYIQPTYGTVYTSISVPSIQQVVPIKQAVYNVTSNEYRINTVSNSRSSISTYDYSQPKQDYIGKYVTLKSKPLMWDSPHLKIANSMGKVPTYDIFVIEKTNSAFYKIQSGNKIGYITVLNLRRL